MKLLEKQEFEVELVVTSRHLIKTYSASVAEAERDAEELYDDGERGDVLSYDIETVDAFPVGEEAELDEDEDDLERLNNE